MKSTKHKIKIKYPQPHSIKIPILINQELEQYIRMSGHRKLKYQARENACEMQRTLYYNRNPSQ
ncbi:MAG: hypothetical protein KJ949_01345 [Nanoarchaeota archaeon]|nr:hypothetical protein [Nanoarchaeota archaeon]MBU4308745.1 hypothetical protein [Nanoarchaeota archaeon]